jgi:hypothetical protein
VFFLSGLFERKLHSKPRIKHWHAACLFGHGILEGLEGALCDVAGLIVELAAAQALETRMCRFFLSLSRE